MARKKLKEGLPVTQKTRKMKTRVARRVQLQGKNQFFFAFFAFSLFHFF